MIGSWRWNIIAATVFGLLIFLLSYSKNPIGTTLYRTGFSFAVGFGIVYAVRYLLGKAMEGDPTLPALHDEPQDEEAGGKGRTIDMVTPENVPEEPSEETEFSPLTPPKLIRMEEPLPPEQIAQAVRHMSNK